MWGQPPVPGFWPEGNFGVIFSCDPICFAWMKKFGIAWYATIIFTRKSTETVFLIVAHPLIPCVFPRIHKFLKFFFQQQR